MSFREISERFSISPVTARRDVIRLTEFGVTTHRGGAGAGTIQRKVPIDSRIEAEWDLLAGRALSFVESGMSVAVAAGPHDLAIARGLASFTALSIVTNSIRCANFFWHQSGAPGLESDVILLPGVVNHLGVLGGPLTVSALEDLSFDICITSPSGFDAKRIRFTEQSSYAEQVRAFHGASMRTLMLISSGNAAVRVPSSVALPARADVVVAGLEFIENFGSALIARGYSLSTASEARGQVDADFDG
jgi:DeoR/GlpR family transcriptional regulator of sugar metabolism